MEYLNIKTGEWIPVEFVSIADLNHAYVRINGELYKVGRVFLHPEP